MARGAYDEYSEIAWEFLGGLNFTDELGLVDQLQAFTAAVDWTETWIRALVLFHICTFCAIILFRKNYTAQTILLFTISKLFVNNLIF